MEGQCDALTPAASLPSGPDAADITTMSSLIRLLLSSVDTCANPLDTEPRGSLAQPDKLS